MTEDERRIERVLELLGLAEDMRRTERVLELLGLAEHEAEQIERVPWRRRLLTSIERTKDVAYGIQAAPLV